MPDIDQPLSPRTVHDLRTQITGIVGPAQLLARQLERGKTIAPEEITRVLRQVVDRGMALSRNIDVLRAEPSKEN